MSRTKRIYRVIATWEQPDGDRVRVWNYQHKNSAVARAKVCRSGRTEVWIDEGTSEPKGYVEHPATTVQVEQSAPITWEVLA